MPENTYETSDNVNVNRSYQNAWIVYINGQEIPVSSVTVSYGIGKPPQAEIVMVPDPLLDRLGAEDRVTVQIFYCDQWVDANKSDFRLLFDGEIIGWSYVNVQKGRSVSFTAVDYIQIFTQIFFFFMGNIEDLAIGSNNQQLGVRPDGVFMPGMQALFPYSLFAEGLVRKEGDTSAALIKRPIDYVYNLVRGLIDSTIPQRSIPAANFFAPWTRRTKFDRRFIALPYLEGGDVPGIFPILKSVQADFAVSAVAQLTSNIGSAGSVWDVFQQVLSTLMMELAMLPTPAAVQSSADLNVFGLAKAKHTGIKPVHLTNYFVKPQFLFGIPPACNVFFPSQVTSFGYQENYATQPTRLYVNDESWLTTINDKTSSPQLGAILRNALSVAYPEEANLALQDAQKSRSGNGKNTLIYPEEFFRGPVVDKRPLPRWFTFLAQSQGTPDGTLTATDRDSLLKFAQDHLPGDEARNLYRKYAAYEFAKEKYSRRNAGLNMPFNPYPVPGFPCAVFDRRSTQLDIFGYITDVRHTLSTRAMSTDISISYGRTFKEVFSLLDRQVVIENEVIKRDKAATWDAIKNRNNTENNQNDTRIDDLVLNMERVGAIAVAPAEPIREIRDVVQNFVRAEAFYRALFYGFVDPAIERLTITEAQNAVNRADPNLNYENQRKASTLGVPIDLPNVTDPDELGISIWNKQFAEQLSVNITAEDQAALQSTERLSSLVSADPNQPNPYDSWISTNGQKKTALFNYPQIIQFKRSDGQKERIHLVGMDATTRLDLILIIDKMRVGSALTSQVTQLETALNRTVVPAGSDINNPDAALTEQLNIAEEQIQNFVTDTNIRGSGVEIVPMPAAAALFESFEAAMRYNSRPICTLDDYINFLGADATPEGKVTPTGALASNDERFFPAVYYRYLRRYRAGPPTSLPIDNYNNASVLTSADGLYVVPLGASNVTLESIVSDVVNATPNASTETVATVANVVAIPDDFPQTAQNWDDVLREYRSNILSKLSPGR